MRKSSIVVFGLTLLGSVSVFAQEGAVAATQAAASASSGWIGLAAGLAIAIAALGGTLAQGKAAAAALDGIARNPAAQPKILTPMILGLALIETLVLFAFVVAFLLQGKI